MTLKEIEKISCDDCISILQRINRLKENMCFKTVYEEKTARAEIKALAKELQELLTEID